jgi:hypothetical protein
MFLLSTAGLFAKATTDGNAAALDKALEALQAFLEKAPESMAGRFAGTVSNNIVKKTCGARPSTAAKGIDCLMGLVELEQGEKVLVRQLLSCHHVHAAHSMRMRCTACSRFASVLLRSNCMYVELHG